MNGEDHGPAPALMLEVLAADDEVATRFVERVTALMHELNVYRGKILAFTFSEYGTFGLSFHRVPVRGARRCDPAGERPRRHRASHRRHRRAGRRPCWTPGAT